MNSVPTRDSLPGLFKDKPREADIDREAIDAICGHDDGSSASAYGDGSSLVKMKRAVYKAIHFNLPHPDKAGRFR